LLFAIALFLLQTMYHCIVGSAINAREGTTQK
jgi:hypothetical protein